jgi:hypothetical protein
MNPTKEYIELDDRLDSIDASVFSSDMLFDKDRFALLKYYVERWSNAIKEQEGMQE